MRKPYFQIGVLIMLLLSLFSGFTVQARSSEHSSLSVTGSAVVVAAPDIAYITLGVETKDPSAQMAVQENAKHMASVFAALKALGLTDKELSTSGYNVYSSTQVHNRGTDTEVTTTTYHVHNRINVTTSDLESVGQVIDAAVQNGANQVQGVRFDIQDKQSMQLEALKSAVEQGMAKAHVMAQSAGITLGGIATMSENYSSYAPMVSTMALRADSIQGTTISPGDVEVSATVNLNLWF
ncbi:MAG TPA: SIMPL domain-containing protein [Limnochordia bacterium]|nr:SIMPL domain-containing protein [Limnochordia bacterium]